MNTQHKQEIPATFVKNEAAKFYAEEELLIALSKEVEQQLSVCIEKFQNMEASGLLYQPAGQSWSIAQCLWHLNSYGHFYLPRIKQALNPPRQKRPFKTGWLGNYVTGMMRPDGGKRKMKAFKDHVPPAQLDPDVVVSEFIEQLETLLQYLQMARYANLNTRLPISISALITLKLGDVFRFLIAHNDRHIQQALRSLH